MPGPKNRPQVKRHQTERWRFPHAKVERWTNAKAAYIGFLVGEKVSSVDISDIMGDGTSPETIRRMIRLWSLPTSGRRRGLVVQITRPQRRKLERLAARKGVPMEVILDRICKTVLKDDLYDAVVDGDE